jgi:Holin of 3TMs, for gene-transfer release
MANLGFGSPSQSISQASGTAPSRINNDSTGDISIQPIEPPYANQPWFSKYWRPSAAWTYLTICIFDFVIFPMMWNATQVFTKATVTQWLPMTLQGAGMIHLAFGAILGVSAYGKTKERVNGLR